MNKPNFLFVSIDGMTDPLGSAQVLPYLINLSKKGFNIGIVSCEKKENFEPQHQQIKSLIDNANITWNYCFYKSGKPFFSQWQNYNALKKIAFSELKKQPNTILHCRSYLSALIGLHAKKKNGTRFIFDMRGFWADERIEGNIWKKSNPIEAYLYSYFKKKETQLLQHADAIVSLTEKAKVIILNWKINNVVAKKITVIPCCADLQHFSTANLNIEKLQVLKNNLPQLQNKFVLSYIGSLGTWYMAKEMLDFFKCLDAKTPAIFLIITKDDKEIIFELAQKIGIPKEKLVIVSAHRSEMPYYITLSMASLFFIKPTFSKSASSPTKLGELLSMGVPVVTNAGIGDVDAVILKSHCGVLISAFSDAHYQNATTDLLTNIDTYKNNTIDTANRYFSLQHGVEKYAEIYDSLL